jgi:hypothetical protein
MKNSIKEDGAETNGIEGMKKHIINYVFPNCNSTEKSRMIFLFLLRLGTAIEREGMTVEKAVSCLGELATEAEMEISSSMLIRQVSRIMNKAQKCEELKPSKKRISVTIKVVKQSRFGP